MLRCLEHEEEVAHRQDHIEQVMHVYRERQVYQGQEGWIAVRLSASTTIALNDCYHFALHLGQKPRDAAIARMTRRYPHPLESQRCYRYSAQQ